MRVYKVVYKPWPNGYYSYLCYAIGYREATIRYELGKEATPKIRGSYLYAFELLEKAREFIHTQAYPQDFIILESEAEIVDKDPVLCPDRFTDTWLAWWSKLNSGIHTKAAGILLGRVPPGTVWCTSLTPLHEVESC